VNRALFLAAALSVAAAGRLAAQEPPAPAPRDTTKADSVRVDSLAADSLRADSLAASDTTGIGQDTTPAPLRPRGGVQPAYRRSPHLGLDPFRYVLVPHWGVVFSAGATADNNALNFSDIGALMLLDKNDSLTAEAAIDALGLVPQGQGLSGFVQGGGAVHLGGPFGRRFGLGFSAQGHAYGSFSLDDNAVALLRDGNGARQDFALGQTRGAGLATAEAGVHAVLRFGATGDQPGLRVIVGLGARYLKPLGYGRSRSTVTRDGAIRITNDSISASVEIEELLAPNARDSTTRANVADSALALRGSGMATDLAVRFELPRTGVAFEAMLANVGSVKVEGAIRRRLRIDNVRAASLRQLREILMYRDTSILLRDTVRGTIDTLVKWRLRPEYDLRVQDTTAVTVRLPRVLRLAASAWVLPMLQVDAAFTGSVTGDFAAPQILEAGATLRLIRQIPLRVGWISAGDYGTGLTGGIGIESRVLYIEFSGRSLGGSFKAARGAGGRVEFGFFF